MDTQKHMNDLKKENEELKQQIMNLKKSLIIVRNKLSSYQKKECQRWQDDVDGLPYYERERE